MGMTTFYQYILVSDFMFWRKSVSGDDRPLAPALPPWGRGRLRCLGITEMGNSSMIAYRYYGTIATGGCPGGGGKAAGSVKNIQ